MEKKEIEKYRQKLDALAAQFFDKPPTIAGPDEEPDANALSQIDITLRDMATGRHRQILEAMKRLGSGTYGACAECGRDINKERLEVIPEAAFCVNCQRKFEDHQEIVVRDSFLDQMM